ncbi:hypothetical protein B7463_g10654, partial [Scytalidium lignicola]
MDQTIYVGMSGPVRKTYTALDDERTMAQEIDRVITTCVQSRLPVYIYVPTDVVAIPLDAFRLATPLDLAVRNKNRAIEDLVVKKILQCIKDSKRPAILVDVLADRHGGKDLVRKLVDLTHFPTYGTCLSKGVIEENSPYFNGIYSGKVSFPGIREAVETSDLVLNIGPLLSDSNTGGFTRNISEDRLVSGRITQAYIWQRIGRFLKPNDIVFVECGTAGFGMEDVTLPSNTSFHTQIFFSSIGFSVGAAFGAAIAARELNSPGRVILIVGDGSLQMTVQEISSFIRYGFKNICIFVINNDGYSIERAIHGQHQGYNDINVLWDYQRMLEFFGANSTTEIKGQSVRCTDIETVDKVYEILMDKLDYPWRLSKQLELSSGHSPETKPKL